MDSLDSSDKNTISQSRLVSEAQSLPFDKRKNIIANQPETTLHKHLKELFSSMDSNLEVIITHGPNELGKDLVLLRRDLISTTARAVVVKCGNITGKANGPIDTIKSQIEMALCHPYTSNGIDEIHILEILVVVTGTISKNAQDRLCKECRGAHLYFYELADLVDLFTAYYPRIFFGGYEYDFLSKEIERLDSVHLFANRDLTLSQAYVEPSLTRVSISVNNRLEPITKNSAIKTADIMRVLEKEKHVALVGEAGCGKSSTLRKLTIDAFRSCRDSLSLNAERNVPALCEARSLSNASDIEMLFSIISSEIDLPEALSINAIFVDGLDELSPPDRSKLIPLLNELSLTKNLPVLISSRCGDYFETIDWACYEIGPMNTGQALALCERVISDQGLSQSLKTGISQMRNNFELTPLAIFLLIDIIEEHQEVPASLTELYERYTDTVLGKHDKEKGIEVLFEYELKKRFLAELAYEYFVLQNVDSISIMAFYDFGEKYFSDFDWPWENWERLLDELKRSSLVVINEKDGSLHFRHRSFLEFFAAYQLHTNPNEHHENISTALDLYFNPFWTDIAFYYFGLKKSMISPFLNQIFDYEDDRPFALVCKMRSGRLLQACWHSRTTVKTEGLLKSSNYAQTIRNSFLEYASKEDPDMPPIFADLVLLSIASESYCSVFLKPQIEQLLHEEMPDQEDAILAKLCLFAGSATLIDKEEKEKLVPRFIDALKATNNKELEGRGLLYLLCSTDEDGNARKTVNRRLKTFGRKYSSIIKGLLPTP